MPDFSPIQNQLTGLYNAKDYAQALDLVKREAANFPQQGLMYHWKMCLAARLNDPAQAIQAFKEATELGYAYPPALLREDEDLQTLQGIAEYEQLAKRSLQLFADLEAHSRAELLVVPPEGESSKPLPLLLGLHGNSQNSQRAAQNWQALHAQGWLLAFPQSSQLLTTESYVWNDLAKGTREVQEFYATLTNDYTIDAERVVLGGFSMGGGLAIHMAVMGAIPARSFIGVGPFIPDLEQLTPFLEAAHARSVRGYILMGLNETADGQDRIRQTAAFLNAHGIPCALEERAGLAHAFPPDFEVSLEKALAFIQSRKAGR